MTALELANKWKSFSAVDKSLHGTAYANCMAAELANAHSIIEQLKEQSAMLLKQAELEKLNLEDGNIHVMIKALNSRGKVVASYEKIHPMNVDHLHESCRRSMEGFKNYYSESNKPEKPVGPSLVSFISGKI